MDYNKLQEVNFEIAVELKRLGFDWIENTGCYYKDKDHFDKKPFGDFPSDSCVENYITSNFIAAPTQSLVCKWFRDIHKILIIPAVDTRYKKPFVCLIVVNSDILKPTIYNFETWEQAESEGIKKAIEILKSQIK